jgi:hypothetical protein
MSARVLTAASKMRAQSSLNQMLFYTGEFVCNVGGKIPSYNLYQRVGRNGSIPYAGTPLFPEAVQSNKVYLPRMSSSPCSSVAARQINAIR